MIIIVERRDVYGRETIYPVCEKARIFAELASTKTLTREALRSIRRLGYDIDMPAAAPIDA